MSLFTARVQCHSAVLLMGLAATVAALSNFTPWRTTTYRVLGGAILLTIVALIRFRHQFPRRHLGRLLALGVVLAVHWFAFFQAVALVGVILACALYGTIPLFVALGSWLFLKETITAGQAFSLGVVTLGAAILMLSGNDPASPLPQGILWMLLANTTFAVLVLCNRVWVQQASPIWVTALQLWGAVPLAWWMNEAPLWPATPLAATYAIVLAAFCTGLAYLLYNHAVRILPAAEAGLILVLEVVYGLLGGLAIGERPTTAQWLAVALFGHLLVRDILRYLRMRQRRRTALASTSRLL